MIKWLRRSFFTGLLITLPTLLTGWILYRFFRFVDGILRPIVARYPFLDIPGLGFASVFIIILVAGIVAGNYLGRKLVGWVDESVERIPMVRGLYLTIKQLSEFFLKQDTTVFRRVVVVQYPRQGMYSIAFVTSSWSFRGPDGVAEMFVNLFIPTTPNPTSGFFVMAPESELIDVDLSIEEGLKMAISGGAIVPLRHLAPGAAAADGAAAGAGADAESEPEGGVGD